MRVAGNRATPANFHLVGDGGVNWRLFFSASSGASGIELWVTDGTTAGTVLVKDTYTGRLKSGAPLHLASSGDANERYLYFNARTNSPDNTRVLWATDRNNANLSNGTAQVVTGSPVSGPSLLTAGDSVLYFVGGGAINRVDVNSGNATQPGQAAMAMGALGNLTTVQDTLYFTEGPPHFTSRTGLAAATEVMDVTMPLTPVSLTGTTLAHTRVGSDLYFVINNAGVQSLWKATGDSATKVSDLKAKVSTAPAALPIDLAFDQLIAVEGVLYITDRLNSLYILNSSNEIVLIRENTADGAADVTNYDSLNDISLRPLSVTAFKDALFFTVTTPGVDRGLWMSRTAADWTGTITERRTAQFNTFSQNAIPALTFSVLAAEGDGVVTFADRTADAAYVLTKEAGLDWLDLTQVVRDRIAAGWTRMTVRVEGNVNERVEVLRARPRQHYRSGNHRRGTRGRPG